MSDSHNFPCPYNMLLLQFYPRRMRGIFSPFTPYPGYFTFFICPAAPASALEHRNIALLFFPLFKGIEERNHCLCHHLLVLVLKMPEAQEDLFVPACFFHL